MSLSKQAIDEYKAIHKKEFCQDITDFEAEAQGTSLINLFRIISKPVPRNWRKILEKSMSRKINKAIIPHFLVCFQARLSFLQ